MDVNLILYNILNVIRHKKFRWGTDYELERLEKVLPFVEDERLRKQVSEVIKQIKLDDDNYYIDSFTLDNILEQLKDTKSALVEIPVSGNLSMKLEKQNPSRIPRLDFYTVNNNESLFGDAKILKSIFIEENRNVTEPYYKVDDEILKILLPENYEITEILLRIIADSTDSIYIPLNLFIKNFDLLKNKRGYFRYVSVYMGKNIDKDTKKLTNRLYNSFKYGKI